MSVPIQSKSQTMSFYYGTEEITFKRVKRLKNTGKILIKVNPDCEVIVFAPEATESNAVLYAVKKKARWIYEKLREFRSQIEFITPRKYISGESHYYLGKQYLLKINESSIHDQGVKLLRGKLEVSIHKKDTAKIKLMLNEWYRARAKILFQKRLTAMLEQTLWVTEKPKIRLLSMQTQWGNCSSNGRITLNPNLVKASRECIDYVILHELCHIAEHNHSDRFYKLMGQVMPSWETTKYHLDGMANLILN